MLTFCKAMLLSKFVTFSTPVRIPRICRSSTSRPRVCVASPRMSSAPQEGPPKVVLAADLTKWTVCVAVSCALLYRRDAAVVLYCVGAGLNSAAVLAHVVMQPPIATVIRTVYLGGAALVVGLALLATSWRVKAGYHTVGQVVAGWLLGAVDTILWIKMFVPWAAPAVNAIFKDGVMGVALIGLIIAAGAVAFLGPDVKRLAKGQQQ